MPITIIIKKHPFASFIDIVPLISASVSMPQSQIETIFLQNQQMLALSNSTDSAFYAPSLILRPKSSLDT